jgi:hypothetical protein
MDRQRAQNVASDVAEEAGKAASEGLRQAEAGVQSKLDQGKSVVQDLAHRASETGRQAMDRAGEVIEGVAPQAKQAASNLYNQGSRSAGYVRQYAAQQPLPALFGPRALRTKALSPARAPTPAPVIQCADNEEPPPSLATRRSLRLVWRKSAPERAALQAMRLTFEAPNAGVEENAHTVTR